MSSKISMLTGAASALLVLAIPVMAKEKAKKTAAAPHIYTQVECGKVKNMHWDDATHSCLKNK